ncbi:hypothetical protein [Lysinibacillus fusiformis]|uniref:hypothetical protein n=1 Tax=Lysinibacillus fusiformis TaxID=28031 RepID=UPI00301A3746
MTEIYVIVDKETRQPPKVRGSRKLPVYTTKGRAEYALKTHMLSEDKYEVATFKEAIQ